MNKNVAKTLIFMAGAAVGAIISAFATKKVVEKAYWDECDKELNEQNLRHKEELKEYKAKIDELQATISQQNVAIAVLGKKVSDATEVSSPEKEEKSDDDDSEGDRPGQNSTEDSEYERKRGQYWAKSRDPQEFYDEDEEEDAENIEENIKNTGPYVIDQLLYETTAMDFRKEDASYYIYDGKVVDADGEWMERYDVLLGTDWLDGEHKNGDVVYVRNEYYMVDYEIIFVADYGERHMNVGLSDDDWED